MNSRFDSISANVFNLGYCGDLHLPDHSYTKDGVQLLAGGNETEPEPLYY